MQIIIAGASRGIGFEVVKKLVLNGNHKILILSRTVEKLESLRLECLELNPQARVIPLAFDLENDDFTGILLPFVQTHLGSVDILLYNAGLLINKPFSGLDNSDFDRLFHVNVKGAFSMIQTLLALFSKKSHILTISSMGGVQGSAKFSGLSLYSASKGALAVLTECLAEEFRDQEIKCNSLALGAVQTEMLSEAFPGYTAPLNPEEMAEFIAEFAIHGHRYFNGKILPVSLTTP